MDRRDLGLVVAACLFGALAVTAVAGASWSISASNAFATPTETFTVEGESFTISSISSVAGGSIGVSVSTSSADRYQVVLYDNDKNIQAFRNAEGSTSVSFDVGGLAPGTYVVTAEQDGPRAAHPIVVSGADVSISVPPSVQSDESLAVSATVAASVPVSSVELGVWGGGERIRTTMAAGDGNTYTGAVSGLAPGTYRVQVGVRGTGTIEGRQQLVGLSAPTTLQVTENTPTPTPSPTPTTPTPTPTLPPPTATTTAQTTTTTPSPTQSTTLTPRPSTSVPTSASPTATPSTAAPTPTTVSQRPTSSSTRSPPPTSVGPTTTEPGSGPITPVDRTPTTSDADGPGFDVLTSLLTVSAGWLLARRRTR